jgi:clan AA aspartic protease
MITGNVADRQAVIEVSVSGLSSTRFEIEAVIDTGYNGYLTLPTYLVEALQISFAGYRSGTLADGSTVILEVYLASVVWHGVQKEVLVAQASGNPLIGMALLAGSRLTIEAIEGGDVRIDELHRP